MCREDDGGEVLDWRDKSLSLEIKYDGYISDQLIPSSDLITGAYYLSFRIKCEKIQLFVEKVMTPSPMAMNKNIRGG